MTTLDICLLGTIEIRRNGELVADFRSQKALVLLAYLIWEQRAVTRDYLAGLLWPDADQPQALGLLRRSIHDLNQRLPACLEADRHTVRFHHAEAAIDALGFAELAQQMQVGAWIRAIELYRAPFLQGIYLDGAPAMDDWVRQVQEYLHQQALDTLDRLARHYTQETDYAEALRYARRALALAPWCEPAHRQVMLLLARSGQPEAAVAQYRQCCAVLMEELGVEPAQETRRLLAQIRAMQQMPRARLPAPVTQCVGRQEEIARLKQLLADPHVRLITLIGPGGIGKTRLALETARTAAAAGGMFLHGAVFVPLGPATSSIQLLAALADALALSLQAGETQEQQLLYCLREQEVLLLLDNFEQLIAPESVGFLARLLREAPTLKILITSRVSLQLAGEHLFWVQGLACPPEISPGKEGPQTREWASVKLFLVRAQQVAADIKMTAQNTDAVAAICRLVQGLPLAIEMAAQWAGILSPVEIAAELTHGYSLLAGHAHDLPLRHLSMRVVFDASWQHLNPTEQTVLAQLSVFCGTFTRGAMQAVTQAGLPVLMRLVHSSFVQRTPDERFAIHELIRQYLAEKLRAQPHSELEAQARHSHFFLELLSACTQQLFGPQQANLLADIGQELGNVRAGWLWAAEHEDAKRIDAALDALYSYFVVRNELAEGVNLLAGAAESVATASDAPLFRRLKARQGALYFELGEYQAARVPLQEALTLAQRDGDLQETAFCLNFIAGVAWWQGSESRALQLWHDSLATSRACGDDVGAAAALHSLAWCHSTANELEMARQFAEEGLVLSRKIGHTFRAAHFLDQLGAVALGVGDAAAAIGYYREAVPLFRQLNDRHGMALTLAGLGRSMYIAGQYLPNEYMPLLEEAAAYSRQSGSYFSLIVAVGLLGQISLWLGDAAAGERCAQEVLDRAGGTQHPLLPLCLILLGAAQQGLGKLKPARDHLAAATAGLLAAPAQVNATGQWALIEWAGLLRAESMLPHVTRDPAAAKEKRLRALEICTFLQHKPWNGRLRRELLADLLAELETLLPPRDVAAVRKHVPTEDIVQLLSGCLVSRDVEQGQSWAGSPPPPTADPRHPADRSTAR